jgi:putative nucleotidyltransferase with HDIG domain
MVTVNLMETIGKRLIDIPMLSIVASRLLSVINDENHSLKSVIKIVENDPSLTSRVLRVANSAAFAPSQPINTLSAAIVHLGEKMVVGIAIASSSSRLLSRRLKGYECLADELWDHSLRTAVAARELADFATGSFSAGLAFTAGLLHDVGKVVISEFLEGSAEKMVKWCKERKVEDYLAAERDLVGLDHALAGYKIACRWKLPQPLCSAIRYHHHPSQADGDDRELVYAVHLGDIIAMLGGTGTGADVLAYRMDESYKEYFRVSKADIPLILLRVQEEFSNTKASIWAGEEV